MVRIHYAVLSRYTDIPRAVSRIEHTYSAKSLYRVIQLLGLLGIRFTSRQATGHRYPLYIISISLYPSGLLDNPQPLMLVLLYYVSDPTAKAGGLCLGSTATQHTS